MNTKHTPGPWTVNGKEMNDVRDSRGHMVACAFHIRYPEPDRPVLEATANAHLIAVSPELLELLATMPHPEYRTGITHLTDEWREWDSKRRAAIAKATGDTHAR